MLKLKFNFAKLKQRLLTAVILFPVLIIANFCLPGQSFWWLISCVFLLAAWEWSQFISISNKLIRVSVFGLFILAAIISYLNLSVLVILSLGFIWWWFAWLAILIYPVGQRLFSNSIIVVLTGCLTIIPAWVGVKYIHQEIEYGSLWMLYLILIVVANDVGAYFAGNIFNGSLLAPKVSPKKTWSGLFGGVISAVLVFGVTVLLWSINILPTEFIAAGQELLLLLFTLIVVIFAIIGDLAESMFKRNFKLKDSGVLLPGHGGVLDRLDSFTASLPLFALIKMVI